MRGARPPLGTFASGLTFLRILGSLTMGFGPARHRRPPEAKSDRRRYGHFGSQASCLFPVDLIVTSDRDPVGAAGVLRCHLLGEYIPAHRFGIAL